MTFDNNNSLKPTRKEEGVTQSGLIEKKLKDVEDQIDDIKERLTPLENTVEGFGNEVNTDSVVATEVSSSHEYTDALSVSGDADVQGTISAEKVAAADVEVSNKVKTKDIDVTGKIEAAEAVFGELSAETIDIETFNADELNATEFSSDNADITNLASDSITADAADIKLINSEIVKSGNLEAREKVIATDAELSGTLEANIAFTKNLRVSRKLNALELIAETMQSGRLFIAPEQMFLIPENGWIHFHNVNAGRFILYLTDFTDVTTNIHSLGNVKFSAVIDYVNNSEKGAVKVLYVQPELKSFEAVYVADNGEIWFKRSSQYLNARRAVVFAESEKELIVDTFAENAQTFDVSEAKSITLRNFNNDDEIVKEKFLKGDYTIDGNLKITGYLTPGQVSFERALFLGYSDYVTADSDGILSAKGAVIDGDNIVAGDETIGGTLSVTGNTDLDADLNVDGETTLNDDVTVTGNVSVTGTLGVTGDVTLGEDLSVSGNTLLHETEINGELTVDADINAAASVHVDKDVSIKGDLYVQGVTYQTEETNVSTTGDYIVTRDNNNTPLGSDKYSGLAVNNYDTGKIATLTADSNGEWRVSDSATATAQTYTNVSNFGNDWFSGLTQTSITAIKGIFTNVSGDELADVVLYNGSDYYHFDGVIWYGTVSVSNGKLVKGNAVTDTALITVLEGLIKRTLVYYSSLTVKQIDASINQPLLTRAEKSNLQNNDILVWDATNAKAVNATRPTNTGDVLSANVDSQGDVTYTWRSGTVTISDKAATNANTPVALCTGATSVGRSTGCSLNFNTCTGVLSATAFCGNFCGSISNATCFNGCTFAQACTAIRSGLTSCTGTVTSVAISVNGVCSSPVTTNGVLTITNVPAYLFIKSCTFGNATACRDNINKLGRVVWIDGTKACDIYKAVQFAAGGDMANLFAQSSNQRYAGAMGAFTDPGTSCSNEVHKIWYDGNWKMGNANSCYYITINSTDTANRNAGYALFATRV